MQEGTMSKTFEGMLREGLKFAVVIARFNEFITGKLLKRTRALKRHGLMM